MPAVDRTPRVRVTRSSEEAVADVGATRNWEAADAHRRNRQAEEGAMAHQGVGNRVRGSNPVVGATGSQVAAPRAGVTRLAAPGPGPGARHRWTVRAAPQVATRWQVAVAGVARAAVVQAAAPVQVPVRAAAAAQPAVVEDAAAAVDNRKP